MEKVGIKRIGDWFYEVEKVKRIIKPSGTETRYISYEKK